jgi:hypothetical protein
MTISKLSAARDAGSPDRQCASFAGACLRRADRLRDAGGGDDAIIAKRNFI